MVYAEYQIYGTLKVDMDRQRLALLLIVIFLFAGLMVYFAVEGFAQFSSYKKFDEAKRDSSTLCDPCFDPNCKTEYPPSQQECNNPNRIVVPTGTPYLPRGPRPLDAPTVAGVDQLTTKPASTAPASTAPASTAPASTAPASTAPASTITPNAAQSLASAADTIKSILGTSEPNMKAADAMPLKGTTQPADPDTVTMSAMDFYDYLRPQILKTVTDTMNKTPALGGSDVPGLKENTLANPMPAALGAYKNAMNSPATAQGEDYSNCKPFNKNEWIRKDSIPCYACTL
jgi:hypothetical protein